MKNPESHTRSDNRSTGTSRALASQRSSLKKRIKTTLAVTFLMVESVVAVVLVVAVVVFWKFSNDLPNMTDLKDAVRPPVPTTIWSEDGVKLGELQVINRQPISWNKIPRSIVNATVAIEDRRFFEHHGIDVPGIGRALLANLSGSNATRQGASTLTQQLVRNLDAFGLTKEKKFSRKVREALSAMRLEQLYSKNQILALYLNNIYYGSGAYGIEAASQTYFGKSVGDLSLSEVALIAGLAQRPSSFTPYEHPRSALRRRNEVLDNMLKYHYITEEQMEEAKSAPLSLVGMKKHKDYDFKAPYFVWYVLNDLVKQFGADYVYHGLKIETTLNWKIQQAAEKELEAGLASHSNDGNGPNQGALVSLDNNTGYIRAMVGGRNYRASQYNNVTQGRRQPGSTFKLFDYCAAFDTNTCELDSSFVDKPIPYPNDPLNRVVKNFAAEGGYSYTSVSCKTAIEQSKNTVAVQVAAKVGIKKVIEYAKRMGITTNLQPYLPTALGASEVHPLELASAYSILPLKGSRFIPMGIVRVTDSEGNIALENLPHIQTDILMPHTIDQMNEALEAVVTSGTGTHARDDGKGNIVENAHGKTGTTSDSRDAWFAGYTPELTTVIWVAQVHHYDTKNPLRPTYVAMKGVTGGAVCAPIWHDFMMHAVPEERKFHLPGYSIIPIAPPAETEKKDTDANKQADAGKPVKDAKSVKPGAVAGTTPATSAMPSGDPNLIAPPLEGDKQPLDAGELPAPITEPARNGTPQVRIPVPDVKPPTVPDIKPSPPPVAPPRNTALQPSHPGGQRPETSSGNIKTSGGNTRAIMPRMDPPPAPPEMVDVLQCVDSGERATQWCTATHTVKMTRAQANKMRRCHTHKPPPGEG